MNRETAVVAGVTTSVALGVYLLTLAPDLTWSHWGGDGGELITAAVTLGIPHPPGYPTYILLGKLISLLPIRPIALAFNLFSALCIALAAGLLASTALRLPRTTHQLPSIAVGLSLAFAPLVWSQAVISEVYGLNLLMLALFLWSLLGKRPFWLSGLFLGLSITTHLTSLLIIPLALAYTPPANWPRLGAGILVGLMPFLALPWLATTGSPVIWGQPTTLSDWWWVVSGRIYHANAFALPAQEVWARAVVWGKLLIMQLTPVGFLLILAGLHPALTRAMRRPNVLLAATAVLYTLYAFTYATLDSTVLLLPALLLGAVLLMPALHRLRAWALLLPLALLLINFSQQDLHQGDDLRVRTETTLQQAPDHAIVLTPGNETIFTLWYFHHVEKQRPDVILVDENLFAFTWYRQQLAQTYPGLQQLAVDDWTGFIAANQASRPIIFIDLHNDGNN